MQKKIHAFVFEQIDACRIDSAMSQQLGFSRSHCQKLLDSRAVLLNGKAVCKVSQTVKMGDRVEVSVPDALPLEIAAEQIDIEIVFEDSDLVVVNKPQGLTVHPSNNNTTGTLVNALLFKISDLSGINGVERPGIVHRLDKDTSGLMVVAKNDNAHVQLQKQIQSKTCKRIYIALLEGVVKPDSGIVDKPIGRSNVNRKKMAIVHDGRTAQTHFAVLTRYRNNTLCEFELKTGRTHQIRVHAQHMGHPVVGDKAYGYKNQRFNLNGQLLHAAELSFFHPKTGQFLEFSAPIPPHFERILAVVNKERLD